jgi:hypothetical protein
MSWYMTAIQLIDQRSERIGSAPWRNWHSDNKVHKEESAKKNPAQIERDSIGLSSFR